MSLTRVFSAEISILISGVFWGRASVGGFGSELEGFAASRFSFRGLRRREVGGSVAADGLVELVPLGRATPPLLSVDIDLSALLIFVESLL
jgi:hypothetical protein